jgi:tRNA dimethylallyltransferase
MTAQPGKQDLQKVRHHLYGLIDQKVTDFNVQKYKQLAIECIDKIHGESKIPVVCGGTNYYIESLMFEE